MPKTGLIKSFSLVLFVLGFGTLGRGVDLATKAQYGSFFCLLSAALVQWFVSCVLILFALLIDIENNSNRDDPTGCPYIGCILPAYHTGPHKDHEGNVS